MTLAEAQVGEVLQVEALSGERSFRRRLMELGLIPGSQVTFLGVAPLGDPIHLLVRGCQLSIRRSEANQIRVRIAETLGIAAPTVPQRAVSA